MTIRIENLTGWIYGCFIGIIYLIPDMIDTLTNLSEEWLMVIGYLGCFFIFIFSIVTRHKAIRELDEPSSFQLLFKREIIFAIIITITRLISWISVVSFLIVAYHLYWVYKNYSIFRIKSS